MKMAPATMTPEQAPMDWIMTFSPSAFLRLAAPDTPTNPGLVDIIDERIAGTKETDIFADDFPPMLYRSEK